MPSKRLGCNIYIPLTCKVFFRSLTDGMLKVAMSRRQKSRFSLMVKEAIWRTRCGRRWLVDWETWLSKTTGTVQIPKFPTTRLRQPRPSSKDNSHNSPTGRLLQATSLLQMAQTNCNSTRQIMPHMVSMFLSGLTNLTETRRQGDRVIACREREWVGEVLRSQVMEITEWTQARWVGSLRSVQEDILMVSKLS